MAWGGIGPELPPLRRMSGSFVFATSAFLNNWRPLLWRLKAACSAACSAGCLFLNSVSLLNGYAMAQPTKPAAYPAD